MKTPLLLLLLATTMAISGCTTEATCHQKLNRFWYSKVELVASAQEPDLAADLAEARRLMRECEALTPRFNYEGPPGAPTGQFSIALLAIYTDEPELFSKFVERGHPIDGLPNPYSETSLHIAVRNGSDDILDWLIEQGLDVNATNHTGGTPLMAAVWVESAHEYSLPQLIEAGADVDATNDVGIPALYFALRIGHVENAELLIRHNADWSVAKALFESDLGHARSQRQREAAERQLQLIDQLVDANRN